MKSIAFFQFSTEEDLSFVLEFSGLDLTDRDFEIKVTERSSNTTKVTLTNGSGITVTGSNVLEAAYAKAAMTGWARGEYSADVVDVTDGAHSRIMAVRFVLDLPGRLVQGVQNRKAFVQWSSNQVAVTATGAIGPAGPVGPQGEQGSQGETGLDGTNGADGDNGWTPELAVVADGARRVQQVVDWFGGAGTKPATGDYVGATGLTPTIGDAVDIRGEAGTATIPDGDKGDITTADDGDTWTINAGVVGTTELADESVDNIKLANMAESTLKGRTTAGTGNPEDLTAAQVKTILGVTTAGDAMATAADVAAQTALLDAFTGDSGGGGNKGLVPAPAAGDASKMLAGDGTWKNLPPTSSPRGYIDGLILSRSAATTLGITAGVARNSTNAADISQASAWTKTLGAFAAGTGNGSLDAGTVANNTGYHVFAISKASGVDPDFLISTSATAPAMPATYTLFRRIGWLLTDGSAQIIDFVQFGDKFLFKNPIDNVTGYALGTSSVSFSLFLPSGVRTQPILSYWALQGGAKPLVYARSADVADITPSAASAAGFTSISQIDGGLGVPVADHRALQTGLSAEVYFRGSISCSLYVAVFGWVDPRGRDA